MFSFHCDERLNGYCRLQLASLEEITQLRIVGSLSLCLGVATDIFTSAALCFFLHNLRTGYSKSVAHSEYVRASSDTFDRDDSLVNRLTLFAVNTGVVTR